MTPKHKLLASIKDKVIKEMHIAALFKIALKLDLSFFAFFLNKIINDSRMKKKFSNILLEL